MKKYLYQLCALCLALCFAPACHKEAAVKTLSFVESELSIVKGESVDLQLKLGESLYDMASNPEGVSFSSSSEAVASVDAKGRLTAIRPGNTVITASASSCTPATMKVSVLSPSQLAPEITLGSFNLWVHSSGTDQWEWELRKPFLAQAFIDNKFDIVGLQEADATIRSQLPGLVKSAGKEYEWWFVCRDSQDASSGEAVGIAYDPEKFELSDKKYFWLSETPDVLSYGWDETSYRRVCAVATVTVRANGAKFLMMATHGPLSTQASASCGELFKTRAKQYNPDGLPCILIGDMNASPTDPLSVSLREYWNDPVLTLDPALVSGPLGTYNAHNISRNMENQDYRIDYIYYKGDSSHFMAKSYFVNPMKYHTTADIYPSDHLPVSLKVKVY